MTRASERPPGMTVAEVIIATGLFGLVLLVVGQLTVASFRVHTKSGDKATVFREATVAADRMERELRQCQEIYSPASWTYGQRFEAGPGGRVRLVFRRADPATGQPRVVSYDFDGQRRTLERLVYDPGFDPARPETWTVRESRPLANRVDGLAFWPVDPADHHGAPFAGFEIALVAETEGVATPSPMPGSPIKVQVRVKGL